MKIKTPRDVGHYIASTRKALKLSQTDLATKIGKDQRFISKLENDPSNVSFGTVMMVLNTLKIDVDMSTLPNPDNSIHQPRSPATVAVEQISHKSNKLVNDATLRSSWHKPKRLPTIVSKHKFEKK
jgi:transcriptional regulator with XRE-family HTH domain